MLKSKRILVYSQRASSVWRYMCHDIAHGFRKLGLDVQFCEALHNQPDLIHPNGIPKFWADIVECQVEWKPQLIFQMGHLRAAYPHGMWSGDAVMATWVQDWHPWILGVQVQNAIPNEKQVEMFNASKDLIFYSFPALGEAIKKQGYEASRVHFLPPGANFDRFKPETMVEWQESSFSFPCHLGAPMTWNDEARRKRRLQPVEWLMDLGYKPLLWGDGWDRNERTKPHFLGRVTNGPELNRAYQKGQFVLQTNSDTFWHQRLFEALACCRNVLVYETEDTPQGKDLPHGVYTFSDQGTMEDALDAMNPWDIWPWRDQHKEMFDYEVRCQDILNALR